VEINSQAARRGFLFKFGTLAVALGLVPGLRTARAAAGNGDMPAQPVQVQLVEFADDGTRPKPQTVPKIVKSEDAWRSQLDHTAFIVTRKAGTEYPFTGAYWNLHDKGVYRCICCDTALFNSETKFESGTGWPSFWQPIAKQNVNEGDDHTMGMARTAVSCKRCDAHLGHVFPDGPRPTGLRYCMNSVSLRFAKAA
jgi:peptide-methionine (R)-S-oxide reductase